MDSEIVIIGTGPGPLSLVTREAEQELLAADKIFFRMSALPIYHWLEERGKRLISFDTLYAIPRCSSKDIYGFIADAILREATTNHRAVYALPGNPFVFENTTGLICRRAQAQGVDVRVVPGISFLELVYKELAIDPVMGLQILPPGAVQPSRAVYSEHLGVLIGLLGASVGADPGSEIPSVDLLSQWLLERYSPDHPVSLVWTTGMPDFETHSRTLALKNLVEACGDCEFFASLYIPPLPKESHAS